ncbi:MAG: BamA/TamA family outer membrane protein [Gemmatimonadota bacterium]|nr:BamA/TamA family outer membrane protein [Gemmatimonadota bacterium]
MSEKYSVRGTLLGGLLALFGCGVGATPLLAQQALVVRKLSFEGNRALDDLQLSAAIATTRSSSFATIPVIRILGLGEKRRFDEQEFLRDLLRLRLLYRIHGFLEAQVDTLVRRTTEDVYITFRIHEGEPVRVSSLEISGLDAVPGGRALLEDLPLQVGDPHSRVAITATADTISERLRDRGYPTATVYLDRNAVDSVNRAADLSLRVEAGAAAIIGSIRVTGTTSLDTAFVRSLAATDLGRPYRFRDLVASQRNLYRTDLFRFANVGIDTTQFRTGDPVVPLLIQVNEGRFYRARASAGYGTTDCFRTSAGWTARNLFGDGRALDLQANLSKLGVGKPFDWGAGDRWICNQLATDSIGSRKVNYSLGATFRKPTFISPDNRLSVSLFAERRSEYRTYLREELGGSVTLSRETLRSTLLNFTYRLAYGGTEANDASFCAYFNACALEDISRLREKRLLGTVTASASRQRVNNLLDPTRGHLFSGEATVSSRVLGSSSLTEFTRFIVEGSVYRSLGGDAVLATRLRGGLVFSPRVSLASDAASFLPPEQRFYAGGSDDVRGFARNELGPVVYVVRGEAIIDGEVPDGEVRVVPTGGNTLVVANVELRLPSPLFSHQLRFAAFVDAGTLWQRGGTGLLSAAMRVTPGIGIRATTPLGPARLDVAYNPYELERGTLFRTTPDGGLEILKTDYRRSDRDRGRLTWHFSVGYPF